MIVEADWAAAQLAAPVLSSQSSAPNQLLTIKTTTIMAKELTVQEQRELLANPILAEVKKFELQQRMGQMLTASTIVPETYRGNLGNCVIAIDMAQRMNMNPIMVMQNLYIVHGNPAWSARFMVACVNQCGRFTPLEYEVVGENPADKAFKCRALAYDRNDVKKERPLYGTWITWAMVDGEGLSKKSGSKWLTMPEQMFRYRAASYWAKVYAPEISMGFPTRDELADGAIDVDFDDLSETYGPVFKADDTSVVDEETGEVKETPAAEPEQPATPTPQQAMQDAIRAKAEQAATQKPQAAPAQPTKEESQSLFGQEQQ
jgi:hypothetical protein